MNEQAAAQSIGRPHQIESADRTIAVASVTLALAAMAVDHLLGDDPGLEDPPMFLIAAALIFALAALLFGRVVPAAMAAPDPAARAARDALILAALAVVPGVATLWIGLPFVLAGAGLVLARAANRIRRTRRAVAAIAIAGLVLVGATAAYAVQAVDNLA